MRRLASIVAVVVVVATTAAPGRADTDHLGASRFVPQFGASDCP